MSLVLNSSGILRSRPLNWSFAVSLLAFFFFYNAITQCARASTNSLKLGVRSSLADGTSIPINPPQRFNYLLRSEIIRQRTNAVMTWPSLVEGNYVPTPAIFDEITDSKPWWGMAGQYIWGEGERSIEGAAEESRFILNPFLLVAANPWTAKIWNSELITADDLSNPDFPYTWTPQELRFWPKMRMAQVIYDVTAFNARLKSLDSKLEKTEQNVRFGLVAYNARDFGYNYLMLSPLLSSNVENTHKAKGAVEIKQYIHTGDSSKFPGGCNNMSPAMDQIDQLLVTKLPARATVLLWKSRPAFIGDPPDFSFVLDFK